jgi:effector-binding domain-containing protein
MIDRPEIAHTDAQPAAVIHLTIPRAEIRTVMGPAINEVIAAATAQGVGPAGPLFSHHFRNDPTVFDFEVGVPVAGAVQASGRVRPGTLPAAKVVRTVYRGPYEGLPAGWSEFEAWVTAQGHGRIGAFWERYVRGPESSPDASTWETELNVVLG